MLKEYTIFDTQRLNSFRAILERYCDWAYQWDIEYHQGMLFPIKSTVYYIKYDEGKLRENWGIIVSEIKKKLCYRKANEYLKTRIDSLLENVSGYEGRVSDYFDARNFLLSGALNKPGSYRWEIKNKFESAIQDFAGQVKEMEHPLVRFMECNGWERETWNFYMDYPTSEEEIQALNALKQRLDRFKPVNQKLGFTSFKVVMPPVEYDKVRWDSYAASYMSANNYLKGKLDIDFVNNLTVMNDQDIFETLYKGRFTEVVHY